MTPITEVLPNSVNTLLATHLSLQKETIISEWLMRVRNDAAIIPPASLSTGALTNHLPQIFDDLTNTLRRYGSDTVARQSVMDAEEHGDTRLRQGYELTEMLRELMHLRAILIYHLRQFEDLNPDFGMVSRLFISTILHRFIDEMAIDATEKYLRSKLHLQVQIQGGAPQGD